MSFVTNTVSKLFGGSDKNKGVNVVADPYGQTRNAYLDWLNPQIGQPGKKYEGELVAPMSEQENKSFDFLRKYGEQGFGDTFNQAKGEISKTLTNQYDPSTSPYYQAVKAQAASNLADTQKNIASNAAGGGRYWSGARLKAQGKAATDSEMGLNTLLGQLSQQERQNMLSVLPLASQMGQAEQQLPLEQAAAYQQLGALPRSIQQTLDQGNYNEWLRSEVDYPLQIAALAANAQTPPTYQQKSPSVGDQLLGTLGNYVGSNLPDWIGSIFKKK